LKTIISRAANGLAEVQSQNPCLGRWCAQRDPANIKVIWVYIVCIFEDCLKAAWYLLLPPGSNTASAYRC
jgi:hypothetical protein